MFSKSFLLKLQEERFSEFKTSDWILYFQYKAHQKGLDIRITNRNAVNSIFASIRRNYTPKEIKLMIDFIFECEHYYSNNIGFHLLSSYYVNKIFNDAKMWENGTYQFSSRRNREYTEDIKVEKPVIQKGSITI